MTESIGRLLCIALVLGNSRPTWRGAYLDISTTSNGPTAGGRRNEGLHALQTRELGADQDRRTASVWRGIVLETGCFTGGIQEFEASLQETHKDAEFLSEYRHALRLIRAIARREGAPIDLQYWTETNKTAG